MINFIRSLSFVGVQRRMKSIHQVLLAALLVAAPFAGRLSAQCISHPGPAVNNVCAGETVTLGATPAATGDGPFTYSWSPATGLSSTTVANPTLTVPASNTTYTLTITDSEGCTHSNAVTVSVLPSPTPLLGTTGPEQVSSFGGLTAFSICDAASSWNFSFQDQSSPIAGSTHSLNWGDGSPVENPSAGWSLSHTYPAGLHTLSYTVTYPNGCTRTQQYIVFLGTNPGGGISTDPNTNICTGGTLPFNINSVSGNSPGTTYVIDFGDGTSVTLAHPPPATITHTYDISSCGVAGGQYTVSFTAQNPCDATQGQIGPIRVSQTPEAIFTMTPDLRACVGQTVSFSDQSLGQQAPTCAAPRHVWSIAPATGWTLSSGTLGNVNGQPTNPNLWTAGSATMGVQFTTPGTYTISDLVGNSCGQNTLVRTICIEEPPVPAFTISPTVGCAPLTSTTVNTSVSPNSCGTTYVWEVMEAGSACGAGPAWTFTGGTSATSVEPQFQFTQPGIYTVILKAINSCGTFQATQQVTVNAPPQVSISPLAGICATQCVNPVATVQSCGAAIDTYAWSFPGGSPANASSASPGQICFANPGSPTVTLMVSNACGSATANANLAVGTLPGLPVISSNSPVCQGQTISLSTTLQAGVTYSWTGPNGFSSTQPSITISNASALNAGTYSVVAISNGCSGPPATVEVTVVPAPAVTIAPTSASICAGESTTLSAAGAGNYQWYIGGVLVGSGPTLTTSPASTTTYTVSGSVGSCPGNATVTVTVYPLPVITIAPTLTLCDQAIPVTLNASPVPGAWSGPFITPDGVFTPVPGSLGVFPVAYTHTNSNSCTSSDTVYVTVQELVDIAYAGPDTAFCPGSTAVILPHSPPGGTWVGAGAGGTFLPSTVGSYTVTYSYGTGTCATSDEVQVQVLPSPVLNITDDLSLCADAAPVPLIGTPAGGIWTGAGVTGPPFEFDPGAVPPGVHALTYTYTDGSGCPAVGQTIATVVALPVANAGSDLLLCDQPVPYTLNATPAGGTWTSGWMNIGPEGVLTPDGVGVDTLLYTVVDPTGCSDTDTLLIEVVEVIDPAYAGADTAVCINSASVQLLGTPAGGTWSGTQVSADGLFTPNAAGTFVLTYSFGSATCLTVDQLTVVVNDLPVVDAGLDIGVCLDGGPQVLVASPAGGTWSGVGVDPLTGVFDPLDAVPGGNVLTYSYTDPATACSNSDDATVTVSSLPEAGFTHDAVGCSSVALSFTNTSSGASNASWTFGDGGVSSATSPSHSYAATGDYTVTLTVGTGSGCTDTFSSTVSIWDVPQVSLVLDQDTGCGPLEVAFTNGSQGDGLEYHWDFGGLSSSSVQDPGPFSFPPDPQASITYTVSLMATNTCGSATATAPVTVIPMPTAAFGPNVNNHCAYSNVPFGNASFGQPDSFHWDFGDGATSTLPGPVVTHSYAVGVDGAEFTITLIAVNACGSDTAQQNITVVPNEVISFFNTDPIQGCGPLTVNLTQYSTGDTTWVWDLGDGNTSIEYEPTHTYTEPGSYIIELFSYGCGFDTYSREVIVYPGPDVAFASTPNAVCVDEVFTFTNLTPGVNGLVWDFGDGNTSTLSEVEHSYSASGIYPVTLTATAALNGCTASVTQSVNVQVSPVAAFEPLPGSGCIDLTVSFQNNSVDASFHSWDFGNGNTSGSNSPVHTYGVAGTYNVTLIAENLNGCSDTLTLPVVAHPLPVSDFSLSAHQSCAAPVTVQAFNSSQGAVGFTWDLGNGESSELNQPEATFTAPGSYTVRLTAVNQFGCEDQSTQVFVVHPTPEAAFTVEPQPACARSPVFFTNGSTNASAFQWSFGDGDGSNVDDPMHTYALPGHYEVVLIATGAGGCTDTLIVPEAALVHPSPTAAFTSDTLSSLRNALQFSNQSQDAVSYSWDFGDGEGSSIQHPTHVFPGDGGLYTICLAVLNAFSCPDTICSVVSVNGDPGVYVPNTFTPNADGLNDVFLPVLNGFMGWNYRLLIFDRWGEVIHETRNSGEGWDGRSRGRNAQVDVYVWKVIVERDGDARDFQGHVTLVR